MSALSSTPRTLSLLLVAALLGCAALDEDGLEAGEHDMELLAGTYNLSTELDLTTAKLLPDLANNTLKALSMLKENPAGTLFELTKKAGLPVVSLLLNAMPGPVATPLQGWINDHFFAQLYNGVPITKELAALTDDIASLFTRFTVLSSLELGAPDESGEATCSHAVAGLLFVVGSARFEVRAPELLATETRAAEVSCNAVHIWESGPRVEDGRLDLRDHAFKVPLGAHVKQGLAKLLEARYGVSTLRDALGQILRCDEMARAVSSRCIGAACVGHKEELAGLCKGGLEWAAIDIEKAIDALDFLSFHFASGTARMWDPPSAGGERDERIDRLADGHWDARASFKSAEQPIDALFSGARGFPPVDLR